MLANNISIVFDELIENFYKLKTISLVRMYEFNETLYLLEFILQEKTNFDNRVLDDSHKNFVAEIFQEKMSEIIIPKKPTSNFTLTYNFSKDITHKILITSTLFSKEKLFIYSPLEQKKHALIEQEKIEQIKDEIWKTKIYKIIFENRKNGIGLWEIIQHTRGIKNPEKRKQYINSLLDLKKITSESTQNKNKINTIYKANE